MKTIALVSLISLLLVTSEPISKVLELLYTLKKENLSAQRSLESELYAVDALCKANFESIDSYIQSAEESHSYSLKEFESVNHTLVSLQSEISGLGQHLKFTQESFNLRTELRCEETTIFLQNLKDSKEALDLIRYMQIDVDKFYNTKNSEFANIGAKISQLIGQDLNSIQVQGNTKEYIKQLKSIVNTNIEALELKEIQAARDFVHWQVLVKKNNAEIQKNLGLHEQHKQKLVSDLDKANKNLAVALDTLNHGKQLFENEEQLCKGKNAGLKGALGIKTKDLELIQESVGIFEKQIRQAKEFANTLKRE